ncbi:MAG: alpha-1,2-fucosyltransferase [Candidatus Paceibacterota bacterium]|jgi:hypothetical protein
MIIVRLSGGLGNQMFQYAFGKSVSIKTGRKLKFDISFFDKQNHRKLEIINYLTNIDTATKDEIINTLFPRNILLKKIASIFKGVWRFSNNYIQEVKSFAFEKNVFEINRSLYFDGYWQNLNYFDDIRDILLKEFQPKETLDDYSLSIEQKMSLGESVSIHVRAGDYLKIPEVRDICNGEYYSKAVSIIKEKIMSPNFFVFCEDEDYAKKILPKDLKYTVIHSNINKPFIDLLLMSKSRNNIIANSSFSWWGAWLNQNQGKTVVCPKVWHNKHKEADITPVDWIKIESGFLSNRKYGKI